MKDHIQAMGDIAAYTLSIDGRFSSYVNEQGNLVAEIEYNNSVFVIGADPSKNFFHASITRKLSRLDQFDPSDSVEIVNAHALNGFDSKLDHSSVVNQTLVVEKNGIEYFDGFESVLPLFVYDDFGPREFYDALQELDGYNQSAFDLAIEELEIDVQPDNATGSDEEAGKGQKGFH